MQKKKLAAIAIVLSTTILLIGSLFVFNIFNLRDLATGTEAFVTEGAQTDTCNLVSVTLSESPSCPAISQGSGETNDVAQYSNTFTLENISSEPITVTYTTLSNWCPEPYGDSQGYCVDYIDAEEYTVQIPAGQSVIREVTTSSRATTACGSYQNDIQIVSVNGDSSCSTPGLQDNLISGAGLCLTGIACPSDFNTCESVTVSYTDPQGNQQAVTSSVDNETPYLAEAGSSLTVENIASNVNSISTDGSFVSYNISCLLTNPQTCSIGSLLNDARSEDRARSFPGEVQLPDNPGETIQINANHLTGDDAYLGIPACSISFETASTGGTTDPVASGTDTCELVSVSVSSDQSCPAITQGSGETNEISEYTNTFTLTNLSDQAITVTYTLLSNWCPEPFGDANGFCVGNTDAQEYTDTIPANGSITKTITSAIPIDAVCGSFQNDLMINAVNGDFSCSSENVQLGGISAGDLCYTGMSCPDDLNVCESVNVTYTDPEGNEQTVTSMVENSNPYEIQAGSSISVNSIATTSEPSTTNGSFVDYAISCLIAETPTCSVGSLIADARADNRAKSLPGTVTAPQTVGEVLQINANHLTGDDAYLAYPACSIRFEVVDGSTTPDPTSTLDPSPTDTIPDPTATSEVTRPPQEPTASLVPTNTGLPEPTATEMPQQPPSMSVSEPRNVCVDADNLIQVNGRPGGYAGVTFQVWARNKDNTVFNAGDCTTGTVQGSNCLIGSNNRTDFTINTRSLPIGNYIIYTQVIDQGGTILCTNNTDAGLNVPVCGRACF